MERNDVIEECIAAVEGLNEQCADLIEAGGEAEAPQHRNHRQAYIQALGRLESLRDGHYDWPAVRPERFQADLFKRIDAFVRDPQTHHLLAEQGVTDPASVAAMCVWTLDQLKASAETRARFLLP